MTVWHDVDERVLAWLANDAPRSYPVWTLNLKLHPDTSSEELEGLLDRQVDEALLRLESYGLVDSRGRAPAGSSVRHNTPRVTALGHRVLGVWPDLEHLSAMDATRLALQAVAEHAPPESRPLLRRAVGIVGEIGGEIVATSAAGAMGDLGAGI